MELMSGRRICEKRMNESLERRNHRTKLSKH